VSSVTSGVECDIGCRVCAGVECVRMRASVCVGARGGTADTLNDTEELNGDVVVLLTVR
jgi:hypothetical protein